MRPALRQAAANAAVDVLKRTQEGDPEARARRKEVYGKLDREVPKDPVLAEELQRLQYAQTQEELDAISRKIQDRAGEIGRQIGRKHPQKILGLNVPVLSKELGASSGEHRAMTVMGDRTNQASGEVQKRLDALESHAFERIRSDLARAEDMEGAGRREEARQLRESAKDNLRYIGTKSQRAYAADMQGEADAALTQLQRKCNRESIIAQERETEGRQAADNVNAAGALRQPGNLAEAFEETRQRDIRKLPQVQDVASDVEAVGAEVVEGKVAGLKPGTQKRVAPAQGEFVESRTTAAGDADVAVNAPETAGSAAASLRQMDETLTELDVRTDEASVNEREGERRLFNFVKTRLPQILGNTGAPASASVRDVEEIAGKMAKSGGKEPDEIIQQFMSEAEQVASGRLAPEKAKTYAAFVRELAALKRRQLGELISTVEREA
jgi:hypothetical protein